MGSVRARITLIAAVVTAVAIAAASFILLSQLGSSLNREIDESLERQVLNFDSQVLQYADFDTVQVPNDPETLLVVVDPDGFMELANDAGVSGSEVADALPLDSFEFDDDVQFADVSLTSPTQTTDSDSLRVAYYEVVVQDQQLDEQFFVVIGRSTRPADRTVSGLRNALFAGVPLLTLLVAALAWWLTGRSLRPVDQMRREVDEISSTDLTRRVSEHGTTDEIGQLAATMNRMLGRLADAQTAQDQFVSDAAHELRTPLASIAAQIDVDRAHPESAEHAQTAVNIRGEVTRLQTLIDGLLSSARGQHSQQKVTAARLVDLDVLASDGVLRCGRPEQVVLDASGIGAGTVRGDETALARLIDNLLANAVRHAVGRVAVAVGTDEHGVWLTVDDDGQGIDPQDRERVFGRFVRLDEARSKDAGGSGLGLALARETATRHGGTLHIGDSTQLGGAQFVLRLAHAH